MEERRQRDIPTLGERGKRFNWKAREHCAVVRWEQRARESMAKETKKAGDPLAAPGKKNREKIEAEEM